MKIALLTDGIFPYVIGGMQKHSFYLAKYFAQNNIHVDLYHTNQSNFDIKKLEFFSEDEKKYIRSFVIDFPDLGKMPGHYIRESFEYSKRIFELFKKNSDVNFIYAKGFCAWQLITEKRKGYKCAPIGVNFHGYEMFQKAPSLKSKLEQYFFLKKPVLFNVRNADFVFSYGGKITGVINSIGVKQEKIIEVPAGIESSWINGNIGKNGKRTKFVFVGRYERRKGIIELNKAIANLLIENDFEFHFVGAIPDDRKIVSEKIIYHGLISDSEKIKLILRNCDILICPSYSEGMPNVIMEAMASGLAVIATNVGAVNLMVSEKNGWLIESPHIEKIKQALLSAISASENDLQLMKENSVMKIKENFLWSGIITDAIQKIKSISVN